MVSLVSKLFKRNENALRSSNVEGQRPLGCDKDGSCCSQTKTKRSGAKHRRRSKKKYGAAHRSSDETRRTLLAKCFARLPQRRVPSWHGHLLSIDSHQPQRNEEQKATPRSCSEYIIAGIRCISFPVEWRKHLSIKSTRIESKLSTKL